MTAPLVDAAEQDLLGLLGLVDVSRARSAAIEDQYLADVAVVYAERLDAVTAARASDEDAEVLSAAFLAALVLVVRRALAAGAEEGGRFAHEQFASLGLPSSLLGEIEIPIADVGDKLVRDFLAGQVAVVKAAGPDLAAVFKDLRQRAELAVVSAVQFGRGAATEAAFDAIAAVLGTNLHKLWVARFDLETAPCKVCVRLHGQHVALGQPFPVIKTEPAPYVSPLSGPPRHPNCRCSLVLYVPAPASPKSDGLTPLTMQAYASWALGMSEADRSEYLAATIVRVKGYTRMVDGKLQHVSGYYYNIQTGQKIPEGQWGNVSAVKQVSAKQAKSMAKVSKGANAATPKGGAIDLDWKPGTYKIDKPGADEDTQIVVHQDGSSTSIHKGKTEDADKALTAQFLGLYKQHGLVQKISDDPEVPDPDGPGPVLEPDAELNKKSTLAEGWYVFENHPNFGGVRVDADGTGKLYAKDFKKTLPLKQVAINQISNGNLGKYEEVEENEFTEDWFKEFQNSKAGGAKAPKPDAPETAPEQQSQGGSGANSGQNAPETAPQQQSGAPSQSGSSSPTPSQSGSNSPTPAQAVPEAPEGGPGGVVKGGPALFSVGAHSVQIEEGSQVYKSGKAKDTLYVLQPDGDLIKYNPQGAGVQATKVGSSENPAARAQQLAKLNNVTDDGISIKDSMPAPGTGKALVGGFEMTSGQLGNAIAALSSNPSGNVAGDLKKVGSPLAAGKFHEVAAPYKAYYNNKTKPALIAALKKAQQLTGNTPASEAPAVAHLAESHGLEEHQASLGHSDTEAIHAALHAVDPQGSDHSHANDGPGFIQVSGTPLPPATVAQAIDALKKSPSKETGVKKPLKAAGSPLAGLDLQALVNNSSVTESFKGSNGKVHYGKLKPAVIALLTDALDKHQTSNPPTGLPAAAPAPELPKMVGGVPGTQAQILEMQQFFDGVDMDMENDPYALLTGMAHNPLALGVDWDSFMESKFGTSNIPDNEMNKVLHDGLNDYLDTKTPFNPAPSQPVEKPEDTSPKLKVGSVNGTVDQLKQYMNAMNAEPGFGLLSGKLPDNPFAVIGPDFIGQHLGIVGVTESGALKAAISDAIQKKIDNVVLKEALPPAPAPSAAPSTISIGGKQITKADLLAAVEAVKSSPSTGVKGPLKAIDSPLSKVDIKAYIESDPLSNPYKGGNGKVHYGKLKDAVAAVLQAKADAMGTPELPDTPAVTPAGDAASAVDAPSVPANPPSAPDLDDEDVELDEEYFDSGLDGDDGSDFFNDDTSSTPSSGELTPKQKIDAAWQNASVAVDLPPDSENGFAQAFQSAAKAGGTWYTDGDDFSDSYSDFEGSWYYEIGQNGVIYEVSEEEVYQKLSDQQILSQLDGAFSDAPGLEEDLAGTDLADPGFYSGAGLTLKVYSDGSGLITNTASGEKVNLDAPASVKTLLDSGSWTKISDSPDEVAKAHVEGVEVGHYAGGSSIDSVSATLYPDGAVFVESLYGDSLMDAKLAKPFIQSMGKSPTAVPVDYPDWMKDAKKGPGGLLQGDYDLGGEFAIVGENSIVDDAGDPLSKEYLAALLFNGDATFTQNSAKFTSDVDADAQETVEAPAEPGVDPKLASLVEKAKTAGYQDSWATTTTSFSKGFQAAVKNDEVTYVTGSGLVTHVKPSVQYHKFTPDGQVTSELANGMILKTYSVDDLVAKLDGVYDGPSVADPIPLPPETANEVHPEGTWEGHPVGSYTNGEGAFIEVTADGPLVDFDEDGVDADGVLEMIESGDLTLVPSLDSPVASTPNMPSDAVKLAPLMTAGYTKLGWLDKPQLAAAVKKWSEDSGFPAAVGQHLSTAKKEDLIAWINHWAAGEWDKAYEIEAKNVKNHKGKLTHPGSPDNPTNAGGFQKKTMAPYVDGELPAGAPVPGSWPSGSALYAWDAETIDAYLVAANMQNPTGLTFYKKKDWVTAHLAGEKIATDSLSHLAQKNVAEGDILSSPILPPVQKYLPGQAIPLPSGFPEIDLSKTHATELSNNQLDQYLNHLGPKKTVDFLSKQSQETKQSIVALHAVSAAAPGQTTFKDPALAKQQLTDLLGKVAEVTSWNEEETTTFIHDVLKVEGKTFTMDKEQPPLAGHSTLYHVTDENGQPFLFKVAPEAFRAEIEHAAHELAQLSGLQVAASQLGTFNGKFGQFQAKIPSKSTLKGVAPTDLQLSALKDLLQAHVQDYVTSNDDAHDDNFLLAPDGKRVIPIDIARAFVRFGQPGAMSLKLGSLSNWEQPYYQKVYDAILGKKYSDADIDELYQASLKQARKTQAVSDDAWASVMDKGLKNRTNFGMTSAKNRAELIQQALARKNGLEQEFEQFWDGIYSKLGREKPAAQKGISKWVYSGVSQDHLAHAEAMGNHGAAAFFGGTALEDGHLLSQVFGKGDGGQELHLSGQLRKDADKALRAWLDTHVTETVSAGSITTTEQKKQQMLHALGVSHYSAHVVAAAKTISHHHKQGDHNYNTSHMANFEALDADLQQKLAQVEAGNFPDVVANTGEGRREYKSLLSYYSNQVSKVKDLKDMGGQSKIGDFDPFEFNLPPEPAVTPEIQSTGLKVKKMPSYFESADLDDSGKLILDGFTSSAGQSGMTYQVTLADGTQIEYRSWHVSDSVRRSQQGQLKIKVREYDGSTAGPQAALAALSSMGVSLNDATEEDMELLYWRHLYGVLQDRKDSDTGKMQEVVDEVKATLPGGGEGTPALSAKEELERWRKAWSRLDPEKFNTFLSGKKWLPRFSRANPAAQDLRGGQPFWMRFDVSYEDLKNAKLPGHSLFDPSVLGQLVKSGGLFSTEDRTKLLGSWSGGMSSTSDQSYGSAGFVFTRINGANTNYAQVLLNPAVLARTSNYAFNGDNFGNADARKSKSYFDFKKAISHTGGSNETLIKHSVTMLDDIEMLVFANQAQRAEAIAYLKAHGVTEIRGLPIEDRLVLQSDREAALAKIEAHRATWEPDEEEF